MSIIQSVENKNGGGRGKIKTSAHCIRSIDYVRREDKVYKISYQNCNNDTASRIADEFKLVRESYAQNKGILCHHYYQSFPKNEKITPEQAYEFAKEYAKKAWPDFQVIISTHIDREHLHSHFIVNNVNLKNGKKFSDNKKSLAQLQSLNDSLCKKYGLSILGLDYESQKYKGLNNATKETAKRKTSWKVELAIAMRAAIENPEIKNQKEFTDFLQSKNFAINYRGKNITVRKNGEEKCIRLNTLAKEAGDIYKQDNIVKRFKIDHELIGEEPKNQNNINQEKEIRQNIKYERDYFSSCPPQYQKGKIPTVQNRAESMKANFNTNKTALIIRCVIQILHLLLFSRRSRIFHSRYSFDSKKYRKSYPTENKIKNTVSFAGNVNYKFLKDLPGENIRIKIYAHQIPKLCNQPFFYSAKINYSTGLAEVTVKKYNVSNLALALGLRADYYSDVVAEKENIAKYRRIKKKSDPAVSYLVVDERKLKSLQSSRLWSLIDIAVFKSKKEENKYNIAFAPSNKNHILDVIYPEKREIEEVRNAVAINRRLKEKAVKQKVKLCYRVITQDQLNALSNDRKIEFAAFKKQDKFNVVFMPEAADKVSKVINAGTFEKKGGNDWNARTQK